MWHDQLTHNSKKCRKPEGSQSLIRVMVMIIKERDQIPVVGKILNTTISQQGDDAYTLAI